MNWNDFPLRGSLQTLPVDANLLIEIAKSQEACQELCRVLIRDLNFEPTNKWIFCQEIDTGNGVLTMMFVTGLLSDGVLADIQIMIPDNLVDDFDSCADLVLEFFEARRDLEQQSEDFVPPLYFILLTDKDYPRRQTACHTIDPLEGDSESEDAEGFCGMIVNTQVDDGTVIARAMKLLSRKDYTDEGLPEMSRIKTDYLEDRMISPMIH